MAEFLAYRIIDEKMTYSQVPARLKAAVRTILTDLGFGYLCTE